MLATLALVTNLVAAVLWAFLYGYGGLTEHWHLLMAALHSFLCLTILSVEMKHGRW